MTVNISAGIGHGLLRGLRVYNGKLRAVLHLEALLGLADFQGMPVQIDGSVLRNGQIRATAAILRGRVGIAGQLKFAAVGERVPDIAGQP